jgi:PIN like domain
MASRQNRSKKRSGGSSGRQPSLPEDFVLYLDENLHNCKPILDALAERGIRHERHGNHFPPGTEDTVWLPAVGKNGWLLLTKDKRIRFNELEKSAVQRYRVREFYFASGNYSGAEMAVMLVNALREMPRFCRRYDPPFIASISKSGKVSLRFPTNS